MYNAKYCKSCGCYVPDNYMICPACGKSNQEIEYETMIEQSTKIINENWASVRKASLNTPVIGPPRILKQ